MAWVVQVDQAVEKKQGLPIRWEPLKPVEVGTGACWFFADSTQKAEPLRCSFPISGFKTSTGTMQIVFNSLLLTFLGQWGQLGVRQVTVKRSHLAFPVLHSLEILGVVISERSNS